ncbi:MAG: hypothetical protein IKN65_03890, partial [Clostridia bacterium]|nr:hypothetical protein [Clostridia bacterium]
TPTLETETFTDNQNIDTANTFDIGTFTDNYQSIEETPIIDTVTFTDNYKNIDTKPTLQTETFTDNYQNINISPNLETETFSDNNQNIDTTNTFDFEASDNYKNIDTTTSFNAATFTDNYQTETTTNIETTTSKDNYQNIDTTKGFDIVEFTDNYQTTKTTPKIDTAFTDNYQITETTTNIDTPTFKESYINIDTTKAFDNTEFNNKYQKDEIIPIIDTDTFTNTYQTTETTKNIDTTETFTDNYQNVDTTKAFDTEEFIDTLKTTTSASDIYTKMDINTLKEAKPLVEPTIKYFDSLKTSSQNIETNQSVDFTTYNKNEISQKYKNSTNIDLASEIINSEETTYNLKETPKIDNLTSESNNIANDTELDFNNVQNADNIDYGKIISEHQTTENIEKKESNIIKTSKEEIPKISKSKEIVIQEDETTINKPIIVEEPSNVKIEKTTTSSKVDYATYNESTPIAHSQEINEAQFVQQPVSTSPKVEFKNNVEETSETHSQEINEAQFVQQPVSTSHKVEFKNNVEETSETHSQEINEAKFVQQPLSIPTTYSKDNYATYTESTPIKHSQTNIETKSFKQTLSIPLSSYTQETPTFISESIKTNDAPISKPKTIPTQTAPINISESIFKTKQGSNTNIDPIPSLSYSNEHKIYSQANIIDKSYQTTTPNLISQIQTNTHASPVSNTRIQSITPTGTIYGPSVVTKTTSSQIGNEILVSEEKIPTFNKSVTDSQRISSIPYSNEYKTYTQTNTHTSPVSNTRIQ